MNKQIEKHIQDLQDGIESDLECSAKKYATYTEKRDIGYIDRNVLSKFCTWIETRSDDLYEERFDYPEFKECCLKYCIDVENHSYIFLDELSTEELKVYKEILEKNK